MTTKVNLTEEELKTKIRTAVENVLLRGYWYCESHDGICHPKRHGHRHPLTCDHCGSQSVVWQKPIDQRVKEIRVPTPDEQLGMTWWNNMTEPERREVLRQAERLIRNVSVAQAWRLWKANLVSAQSRRERV